MAKKQPKPSAPVPDPIEQRVHEMMDLSVPDLVEQPEVKTEDAKKSSSKKVSISITHHDEEEKSVKGPAPEITDPISDAPAEEPRVLPSAPLVESKPPTKKVTVVHHEDDAPAEEPAAEPEAEAIEPESVPEVAEAPEPAPASHPEQDPVPTASDEQLTSPLESTITSAETERAVSDIIAKESDALLAAQDEQVKPAIVSKQPKPKKKGVFKKVFGSSAGRWTVFLLLFAVLAGVGVYPKTRYYLLNAAGVTSQASLTITDQSSLRPLKNAKVTLAGKTVVSDEEGLVQFEKLPLGPTTLSIEKRAFAGYTREVIIGWGSNPLEDIALKPQGQQYVFNIKEYLSGDSLADVEASVGELTATSNEKGEIKLTLDKIEEDKVTVQFKATGYRDYSIELLLNDMEPKDIELVPSKQLAFITKRNGTYDLYKVGIDGKQESIVLTGSGRESNDIALLQHENDDIAALISTREGTYTSDKKLQQNLTLVNLKDASTKLVASSTQIKALGWSGSRLVYVILQDEASEDDAARFKLMSYDYRSGDNRQLAAANYFNSVLMAQGRVYYAPASASQDGINVGVFEVLADGSGKRSVLDQEAWNLIRTAHGTIRLAVQQDWYELQVGDDKPRKLSGQPGDTVSRLYIDNSKATKSIWLDNRDGKSAVVLYDITAKSDTVLTTATDISGQVRWLTDNLLVYRVSGAKETADYLISVKGGEPRKVVEVTNASGVDRWSY